MLSRREKELQPDGTWKRVHHPAKKPPLRVTKKMIRKTKCRYCLTTKNLTIDHKIPKCQGGSNDRKNLQCLCGRCNQMKSGLSHKQVVRLFLWFQDIQKSREGKKFRFEKDKGHKEDFTEEQNKDSILE